MRFLGKTVAALLTVAQLCGLSIANPAEASDCKAIPGDPTWPAASVWKQELPKAMLQGSKGTQKHATYRIDVETVDDVVAAVKFAAKHNIRLNVLNSGHDFLGRNDAPNGLVIVVTALRGM